MKIGIIVAMASEAKALENKIGQLLGEIPFTVRVASPGLKYAEKATEQLLSEGHGFFISWGVSGGLNPSLQPGRLLISQQVATTSDQTLEFTSDLEKRISDELNPLNPILGRITSTEKPTISPVEKSKLHSGRRADAVDMESIAIAKIAKKNSCGFLSIRSIVDSANFEIPSSALAGMNSQGNQVMLKVLKQLAHRPKELKSLIELSFHFRKALKTLSSSADLLIK
jgi:adenosylhomocysteine nucleosidase